MSDNRNLLEQLSDAAKLRHNWYTVASLAIKIKYAAVGYHHPAKNLKDAAIASGYTTNTLNRMLTVKGFVDASIKRGKLMAGVNANLLSFPSLELVQRLYEVDPADADAMLDLVASKSIKFSSLRAHYNTAISKNSGAASPHQLARVEKRTFKMAAHGALLAARKRLLGTTSSVKIEEARGGRLPIDAVGYTADAPYCSSFEFVLLPEAVNQRNALDGLLYRAAFIASFFNNYWLIFASSAGSEQINVFSKRLDDMGLDSIGVAALPWNSSSASSKHKLQVIRMPTAGPIPDRREMLADIEKICH